MAMATAMPTTRLPRPTTGPYIATVSRARCSGGGCSEPAGGPYSNKRNTKTQAIRFVAEDEAKNEYVRCGGTEADYMLRQAEKPFSALVSVDDAFAPKKEHSADDVLVHAPASEVLDRWQPGLENAVQVCVIGAGPAGLALASELGKRGIRVGVVSPDRPFTNTYGVWADEFRSLGFAHTIEHTWDDAVCFFGEEPEQKVRVGRAYAKVGRVAFRQELLRRCQQSNNVVYTPGLVESISSQTEDLKLISVKDSAEAWYAGMIVVAAGGMGGQKFIEYEQSSSWPLVGAQTAYGIECEVESHPFDLDVMHFMDYRDCGMKLKQSNGNGAHAPSIPSFLYAMPLSPTRIFLEETCLAAKEPLAFEVLRERLTQRLHWLGITNYTVLEEEWSYIPIGGPLPTNPQAHVAFGVSANMVHPATGYSIARSLGEAAPLAEKISSSILARASASLMASPSHGSPNGTLGSPWAEAATQTAWKHLWPNERRRRQAFNTFGMELLAQMELEAIQCFFLTFFRLPDPLWKNFLSSNLSSLELLWFALSVFLYGSNALRLRLIKHLLSLHGVYLIEEYSTLITDSFQERSR